MYTSPLKNSKEYLIVTKYKPLTTYSSRLSACLFLLHLNECQQIAKTFNTTGLLCTMLPLCVGLGQSVC